jgi:glycosyltransferase involved in cell wall biosynthesis
MLRGNLDQISFRAISGWVQDPAHPDEPVSLVVTNNDKLVTRVLANRYRGDLAEAEIGNGRHAFEIVLVEPLSPFELNHIRVFSEADGRDVPGSPVVLKPSRGLGANERQYLSGLLDRIDEPKAIDRTLNFLIPEVDKLKQRLAERQSRKTERETIRSVQQRGLSTLSPVDRPLAATDRLPRRALVIDERVPKRNRDAASNAILSHMESLKRLGYDVAFAATEQFEAQNTDLSALESIESASFQPPLYGSIEEVMRRQDRTFDVVYLHRVSSASRYLVLARHYFPKARIIYSVADLHHIRLSRQAEAEDRPELVGFAKRVRLQEFMATATADAVITHSPFEAELLRKEVRGANVHVVPWSIPVRPTQVPFAKRRGMAFIGGFRHQPNGDAARWLISEIMPLVRKTHPEIKCLLVGSELPEWLAQLCGDGIEAVGHVDDLVEIFDRVRLTVAPLTYGAGIKGKVIESMASGIPCVCTPVAAEGLDLPEPLRGCVAGSADELAAIIGKVHARKAINQACQTAGLQYVAEHFSDELLDQSLRKAVGQAP